MRKGLYNPAYEHDACGVGMVVNIHGNKSHELVDNALKVLENMRHRGAEGADNKTGRKAPTTKPAMVQVSCCRYRTNSYCFKGYLYLKKASTGRASFSCPRTPSVSRTS